MRRNNTNKGGVLRICHKTASLTQPKWNHTDKRSGSNQVASEVSITWTTLVGEKIWYYTSSPTQFERQFSTPCSKLSRQLIRRLFLAYKKLCRTPTWRKSPKLSSFVPNTGGLIVLQKRSVFLVLELLQTWRVESKLKFLYVVYRVRVPAIMHQD